MKNISTLGTFVAVPLLIMGQMAEARAGETAGMAMIGSVITNSPTLALDSCKTSARSAGYGGKVCAYRVSEGSSTWRCYAN